VEEALDESPVLQRFVGVELGAAPAPDATTICRFRSLLEKHDLLHDAGRGKHSSGCERDQDCDRADSVTGWDTTILHAPPSTKKAGGESDPEMDQTRKGNQCYFGLKAHLGVDAKQGTVHSVVTTVANVADCRVLPELLHGEEPRVWGDGGYQGQTEAIQQAAPKAQDRTCKRTRYKGRVDQLQRAKKRSKLSMRAKVEHPFRILKRTFGFDKVRYRGLAKNHHRLCACFALVNL
jgi:IS5 family transposase